MSDPSEPTAPTEPASQSSPAKRSAAPKRGRRWVVPVVVVALVLVAAGVMIFSGSDDSETAEPSPSSSASAEPAVPASVETITSIPSSAYDQAGVDAVDPRMFIALPPDEPPLEQDGKPEVLYIGAEFCPFCAGERWAVVAALSRFGEFSGLGESQSSVDDVYPATKTLTFYGSSFTSDRVVFEAVETSDSEGVPLETPTPEQEAIIRKYDAPPYLPAEIRPGSIPFLDIANSRVVVGSTVPVEALQGMTAEQIAIASADPTNPIGATVLGSANLISAIVCSETGGEPVEVCSSAGVTAGAEALGL